jgi:3'-5' exonuclease
MQTIFFDIETGALAESEIAAVMPPFDPAEVKTGNLKDPDKIAAKLAEAEANHRRDFIERAALDPLTGRVVAIGLMYLASGRFEVIGHDDEAQTLRDFWAACRGEMGRVHQMVGFNTHQFDLPFLVRRSWKHRIEMPYGIRRGRWWSDEMVDLRDEWQLGDRQSRGSLDSIAKHLGLGGKTGDGKAFAELWRTDRKQATAYLHNDVELTARVAGVLGVTGVLGVVPDDLGF